jgi:hypothetical protein
MTARNVRADLRRLALAACLALSVAIGTGAAPTAATRPELRGGAAKFVDYGGRVLSAAQIYLIYWGSAWISRSASPTSDEITTAMQTVVASSYLAGLTQYRNVGPAVIHRSLVVTSSEPPSGFTDDDIAAFLDAQFDAGALPPANDQALYFVTIPPDAAASDRFGAHSYYERAGRPIRYAWTAYALTVNFATRIMTHELVEAITDPDGDAFRGVPGTCSESGWCEIADICFDAGVLDGVMVNSY